MFLISTRLGLIACRHLVSGYYQDRYVSAPEIAEKNNMNVRALMPALRQMTRADILRSRVGGKEPGFIFSRNPKDISVLDILVALEGESYFVCCKELNSELKCDCMDKHKCDMYELFNSIISQAKVRLSNISIKDYSNGDIKVTE